MALEEVNPVSPQDARLSYLRSVLRDINDDLGSQPPSSKMSVEIGKSCGDGEAKWLLKNKDEIINLYKAAGWQDVSIKNSQEHVKLIFSTNLFTAPE